MNLNEINKVNDSKFAFTFSYGRALQQSALKTWAKDLKDTKKVYNMLLKKGQNEQPSSPRQVE